jgi:hypothetical protein
MSIPRIPLRHQKGAYYFTLLHLTLTVSAETRGRTVQEDRFQTRRERLCLRRLVYSFYSQFVDLYTLSLVALPFASLFCHCSVAAKHNPDTEI